MGNPDIEQSLADLPFFAGLDDELVARFAECARLETYGYGHYLFFEGEPADSFFAIRRGKVALTATAGSLGFMTIEMLGAGDVVGWSWIFPPFQWSLTCRAQSPCELIVFDARCLRGMCAANTDFTYELMKRMAVVSAARLRAARFTLLNQIA